jgi:hypothetical protein
MRERQALQGNATRSGHSYGRSDEWRASAGRQIGRTYCEQVIAHNRECWAPARAGWLCSAAEKDAPHAPIHAITPIG